MKRSPKILIVSNSTWNIYNFRMGLIRRLKQEGYRIVVVAPLDEYIHYINESYFTRHVPLESLQVQRRNPFSDLRLWWELFRIYRREKPAAVIHFTVKPNVYGNLAAGQLNIPSVGVVTGLGYPFLHSSLLNRLVPRLYKWAFRKTLAVVFYNQSDKALFLEKGLVKPQQAFLISGSGVNTNHFRPLPRPENNKFIFLFVGRLLYDKGIREYFQAARQLKATTRQVECWIIGDMDPQNPSAVSKEEMLHWLEEKHVRYFGEARDVRSFLRQADVVVHPSYREGIPRAVLEAMSMGKPVIATDVPGCRETVQHGTNGMLVPARDAEALAEAMVSIYYLPDAERERMGNESRRMARQQFDEKVIMNQFINLLSEVLDRSTKQEQQHSREKS